MNKRMTLAFAALMGVAMTSEAGAQTCSTTPACTVNSTASVTVPAVLQLTLSSITTALTAPTAANFDAAGVPDAGPSVTVKANKGWTLKIAAGAASFTGSGGANLAKASTDLAWSTTVAGTFTGLVTGGATVLTSATGSSVTQNMFYQTSWHSATDTPGTYSLVVAYTLSEP